MSSPSDRSHRTRRLAWMAGVTIVAVIAVVYVLSRSGGSPYLPQSTVTESVLSVAPNDSAVSSTSNPASSIRPTTTIVTTPPAATAEIVASVAGRRWIVFEVDGESRGVAAFFELTDSLVLGHDGCNRFGKEVEATSDADGVLELEIITAEFTHAECSYTTGWDSPDGRYLVDGENLTIEAADGRRFTAIDADALAPPSDVSQVVGEWEADDGIRVWFDEDGSIRLICGTIGSWSFDGEFDGIIDQYMLIEQCGDGWTRVPALTYGNLVEGSPTVRMLPDGSLLFGVDFLGILARPDL